jgi:hypothetical protein
MAERIAVRTIYLTEHPPVDGFRSRNAFELEIASVVNRVDWRKATKAINESLPEGYKASVRKR